MFRLAVPRLAALCCARRAYSTPGKVKVCVTTQDGTQAEFEAPVGVNLMTAVRDVAQLEMQGACDGCMVCGTCHVYLSKAWYEKVPEADDDELDILDKSLEVQDTSRLACQINLTSDMDGIEVTLPKKVANLMM
ncbi:adrenodoxin-like protein [Strigomonas culicis]|uniref:Adrenodoxin-like protein n=1 Tax=Strigomonas culicis TaxID=28005 RepID=S9UY01_9TRYP|nr:adrenodoxin-like protein [Strigomonas culicis]EPY19466.1 adrenodoxin-like protein [Strigomonas culicis]|eukprot:EPY18573.1 adrenodoxin-like protein [Strigomonas culicis]